MRKILRYGLVLLTLPFFLHSAQGQPDRFAYAVTALNKGGSEWVALRKLDTQTGEFGGTLLKMTDSSVAAIAYDRKAHRLYYAPMNTDQLRCIDLATMKVYTIMEQSFSKAGNYKFQPSNPITRMVIAPDDYGYTITNDGNHLIRFSTHATPTLTDLGELLDDPLNKEMTIHNPCANSGGDMVADDAGHLYLISASNRVYKVDIATRMTTFVASISGLPQQFTSNGAAVDENGKLLISGSGYADAYFIVDPATWNALPSPPNSKIYGSADLANSNVFHTKNPTPPILILNKSLDRPSKIKVFPDPVLYDEVSIQFNELPPGNYTIQLTNVLGRKVIQQKAIITEPAQTEIMYIPGYTAQGLYYIRVLNENNILVGTQKLAVTRRW
ncbi:T9SS type A sorting domain-containing protein [Flavitalea sp. BT771]|uniref:T9SS type A sorting domain-containing protein n=1 Tax=Flavitalea sp. BT771 TaxID=3063329 RepID=UPI0026E40F5F|nr:T9SS type A sorting domain-containing protein [Flavitalea sp. BT771]MDO6430023.1 T9SS type A sorting domain-containing protein [Flavitalea sp. BT771]MDV6219838.1 T9SS type A sorting domain-containing protein [Flavitalea sp. BT771]